MMHQEVKSILFVCIGNTCRSVFAEHIAKESFPAEVIIESAGVSPQSSADAENAVFTLQRKYGIDASGHLPRAIHTLDLSAYDLLVFLDKGAAKRYALEGFGDRLRVWNIKDPYGDNLEEYDKCASDVKREVLKLKGELQIQTGRVE